MNSVEYAYVADCAKQGCDPPHWYDGRAVIGPLPRPYRVEPIIDAHATTLMQRTIIEVPEWQPVDSGNQE